MLADDVMTLIAGAGLATEGTDLFTGALPASPDAVTVVAETTGRMPEYIFSQGLPGIERPRIQIRTRGAANDYEAPRIQIERVYQLLAQRGHETVSGGARYLTWAPIQAPFAMGQDKNERWIFAVNLEVWKEASALP